MENYVCELLCRQRGAPSGTLPRPFPTFTEIRVLRIPLPSQGGGSPPMAPPRAGAHRLPLEFMGANQLVPAPPRSSPDPTAAESEQRKDRENIDETGEGCLTRSGGTGTRIILGRGSSHRTARSTPRGMHVKETRALSTAESPQHSNEPSGLDQRTSAEPGPSPVERGSRSRHRLPCEDTART